MYDKKIKWIKAVPETVEAQDVSFLRKYSKFIFFLAPGNPGRPAVAVCQQATPPPCQPCPAGRKILHLEIVIILFFSTRT